MRSCDAEEEDDVGMAELLHDGNLMGAREGPGDKREERYGIRERTEGGREREREDCTSSSMDPISGKLLLSSLIAT